MARRPLPAREARPGALQATRAKMSFETISLLLSWLELGLLFGILFRLAGAFDLIASTQRELRRTIHHLGERHAAELAINNSPGARGIPLLPARCNFVGRS